MLVSPAFLATLLAATALPAAVSEVTVFGGVARVVRAGSVAVAGRALVELPALPASVDPASVRLETAGAGVEVDAVELRPVTAGELPAAEARAALRRLEELDDALAQAERERAVFERLEGVRAWQPAAGGGDEGEGRPLPRLDARGWQLATAFLMGFGQAMQARERDADARLRDLRRQRETAAAEARRLATGAGEGGLRVLATLIGHGRAELRLCYQVSGASWTPAYDVRLEPRRERVTVALAAQVSQSTGEDWEHARLAVSTALPTVVSALPVMAAWRIGERERFVPTPAPAREEARAPPPPSPPIAEDIGATARLRAALLARAGGVVAAAQEAPPAPAQPRQAARSAGQEVARPQAFAGSAAITGTVFDQTGTPLKGVKISASGAPGGARVAYSNDEGTFYLRGLAPGGYDLRATAPKLRAYDERGVVAREHDPADLSIVMEVESSSVEEVRVVERAPTISTTAPNVRETMDLDFVEGVPTRSTSLLSRDTGPRETVMLAPPPAYLRPTLAPDAPASRAGGRELTFAALAAETVRSGAGARRVPLASWTWPVAVERAAYPALAPDAFLVATLASPAEQVLPAGDATLWVDAEPAGTAALPLVVPGQPFTLPLGLDRAVRPVRQVTFTTAIEGLIKKDEVTRYTVTTELTNPHGRPMRVQLHDQLPISTDRSVDVALVESAPAATLDNATGALHFALTVAPGKTATVRFTYTLRRPKGRRLAQ